MTPERAMEIARSITETIYKEEIAQAILTACEAESKLAAATLEPSPCGVAGHRQMDCKPLGTEIYGECFTCLACQREQAVAAAMVEKCADAIDEESKKIGKRGYAKAWALGHASKVIRSFCPVGVLDELLRKARLEEALWWNKQFSLFDHDHSTCTERLEHLAALRATPQSTAVKEEK